MFRKAVSSFVLVAFVSMLFYSCSGESSLNPGNGSTDTERDMEEILNADPDVQAMIDIRGQLVERALFGGIDSSQLRQAMETDDPEYTAALFGYSASELATVKARIVQLSETISGRYPEIVSRVAEMSTDHCGACDIETFLDGWGSAVERFESDVSRSSCIDPARCEVIPLVVGLIMCAYTLGWTIVGYLACSYVVTCSFCEGGWADLIC